MRLGVLFAVSLTLLTACNDARAARESSTPSSTTSTAVAQPSGLRWAKTLDWTRRATSKADTSFTITLTVREPWKGAREPLVYDLLSSGVNKPTSPSSMNAQTVRLPARRIAALGAVHTGYLVALGAKDRIVAVDAKRYVYDADVRARINEGRIVEVSAGSGLNVERLLKARPDLVLSNAVGASEYAALERLRRAGIPVLITAEWMEQHALARAEWVRLVGILIGEAASADSLFAAIEGSYTRLAASGRAMREGPTVLLGGPFRDQWFVSGGRSFMAGLIADAGGNYLWKNDTTAGGVPYGFEAVLAQARSADVWLHPGDWKSLADGTRQDARFKEFGAFRRGDVYNSDARSHADGANDYWETGVVRPDRVLADLLSLFHGTEDSLYYYRRLVP